MNFSWIYGILLLIQPALSDHLTVKNQGEEIAIIERTAYTLPIPGTPLIDLNKYHQLLNELDDFTHIGPKNAYIDYAGRVRDGELGRRLHRMAFTNLFYTYFYSANSATVELPMMQTYPKVDADLLAQIRVKRISQYTTFFNSRNKARRLCYNNNT